MFEGEHRLYSYWYNRSWHNLDALANGPLIRLTVSVPLFGYLVLFNDTIVQHLSFSEILDGQNLLFLSSGTRLRFIYFGLVGLSISCAWYLLRRPYVVKIASSPSEYVVRAMEIFTTFDFVNSFGTVDQNEHTVTNYWEYGRGDLDNFIEDVSGAKASQSSGLRLSKDEAFTTPVKSRTVAIDKHSEFVRSLLLEEYAIVSRQRKPEQQFLHMLCIASYASLTIPGIELFCATVRASVM